MTEYEIADLAASKIANLIGLGSMIQVQVASIAEAIQQFMTILFGYLAAAYFVGAKLDRRQAWILTSLYILWQLWTISSLATRGVFLGLVQERFVELLGATTTVLGQAPLYLRTGVLFLAVAALLASLYFMWSVRHPQRE
jgi:hypothetical protein